MLISDIQPITEKQVHEIITWAYEPPYDLYNLSNDPHPLSETIAYFLRIPCYAIMHDEGTLLAFFTFGEDAQVPGGDYSAEALDIGLGVHPDLTGKGMGEQFVTAVINFAIANRHPPTLRVTIAEFNKRAYRIWEKQGFQPQQKFTNTNRTKKTFFILTKPVG